MNLTQYTDDEISSAFEKTIIWFKSIESIDFNRMQLQIDWARKIIESYRSGKTSVILSAPTGFGKSLLAFFLTKVFYNLESDSQSYCLTSNKFLQSQYNSDIDRFRFENYAMLQGQTNYQCHVANTDFPNRPCIDESLQKLTDGETSFKCSSECAYLIARNKAIGAETTVFNYHYWLTSMNKSFASNPNAVFAPRSFTVFDECHIMGNIVQDMFTIEFNLNSFIRKCLNFFAIASTASIEQNPLSVSSFETLVQDFELLMTSGTPQLQFDAIESIIKKISDIKVLYGTLVREFSKKFSATDTGAIPKSKEDREILGFLATLISTIEELSNAHANYKHFGLETMVITSSENDSTIHKPIADFGTRTNFTVTLRCTNESELVKDAVHKWTEYSLFMSATIGHPEDYALQIGLSNWEAFEVPQVFSYENCEIFTVQPMISMSYKDKNINMPKMMHRIMKICAHHPNERGLIHSGNFEIMKEIQKLKNPRILTYSSSAEKENILELLKTRPDAIICGPSLVEGVSLDDDLCRFMICAKVPYQSIGDELTKKKMHIYPNWYNWLTLSSILQSFGRPIRSNTDWCKTYLLDESFANFFKRYSPPSWISSRIVETHIDSLGKPFRDTADEDFDALLLSLQK
jgi:Rad3-related DNA helicase